MRLKVPPLQPQNIKRIEGPQLAQSKAGHQQDTETQGNFFRFTPEACGKQAKAENIHTSHFDLMRSKILPTSRQIQ